MCQSQVSLKCQVYQSQMVKFIVSGYQMNVMLYVYIVRLSMPNSKITLSGYQCQMVSLQFQVYQCLMVTVSLSCQVYQCQMVKFII